MRDPLTRFHSRYRFNREILPKLQNRKMIREARTRSKNINDCVEQNHTECNYRGTLPRQTKILVKCVKKKEFNNVIIGGINSLRWTHKFHFFAEIVRCVALWGTQRPSTQPSGTLRPTTWWWGCWRCWRRPWWWWSAWCPTWWMGWWRHSTTPMSIRRVLMLPCQLRWWRPQQDS